MFQRIACKAVMALLLVWPAAAGAGERFVRPVLSCPLVQARPEIDGRIDEPAWRAATRVTNFCSSYGDRQAVEQTEVYLCCDSELLYIAVRCRDSQMDKIVAKLTRRDDNIFWDDSVEIFIDPGLSRKHFMQFIVNPLGAMLDLKISEITELGWNANCQVAAAVGKKAWTVELAIPFAELGLASPKPGQRWGINFTRTTHRLREYSCWSPTGSDRFQVPRRFGDMVFTAGAGLQATIDQVDPQTHQIELTFDGQKRPLTLEVNAVSSAGDSRSVAREIAPTDLGKPIRMRYLLPVGWEGFALNVVAREAGGDPIVYRSPSIPIAASAEAKLDMARQEIYRLKADMMLLKASVGPGGYVLAPARPFETAMPQDFPDVTSVGQPIRVSACGGEYEPGSLLIYTSTDLKAVRVGLESDLKCAGRTIPKDSVDIRILKRWFQGGPGQKYFKPVLTPELLLKNDALISVDCRAAVNTINFEDIPSDGPALAPFDVPAYSNKKVWLTVHVPPETPAGLYKATLRATPAGQASAGIAVEVNVLPFELREAGKIYTVYYYSPRIYHYGESPEAFVNELADMRAHGLTSAAVMSYDTEFSVDADGAYRVNLARLKDDIQARVNAGLRGPVILSMQTHKPPFPTKMFRGPWAEDNAPDPAEAKKLAFLVREIQQMVHKSNLPPVHILGIDEPNFDSTGAMLERCRRIFEIIQGAGGRAVTAIDIDGSDRLGKTIDMPIYNAYSAYRQFRNPTIKSSGKIELVYWHPLENPVHDRFHFGLMVWRANLDGACPYAYRHVYQGDPFRREDSRDTRKGERNSMYTYPSKTGPIPTIQWEAAREGIDDVRYLQTLTFWTGRAAASGAASPEAKQAIAEARAILAIDLDASRDYDALLGSLTPADFDSLREKVIRSIVRTKSLAGH